MYSVKEVMESRNLAVIGASRDPEKPGSLLLKLLRDTSFQGRAVGVNPHGGEVHGIPLYRNINDIPFSLDLAVFLIPPRSISALVAECARKGVKGVVISSEGFSEVGKEGEKIQDEIGEILKSTGMRGFGPNTLGLINTATGLSTSYIATPRTLQPGSLGFISQSGIFIGGLLRYLSSFRGLRLSKGLGLGNKVDVDECEALEYLMEDEQTRIIGMYLEGLKEGKRFIRSARSAVMRKPVLLLKGGRTRAGGRAAASHTASLAVDDRVFQGALRQTGILRMADIDELKETVTGFQCMPLPRGDKIALVTYSGAQAIMCIDAAIERGLSLARFEGRTTDRLSRIISAPSKMRNPVDIFPDMMTHGFEKTTNEIFRALLDDNQVDGIIFVAFALSDPRHLDPLLELIRERSKKPVFFTLIGNKEDVEVCESHVEENGVPFYLLPEKAVKVFSNMLQYARTLSAREQND
jgi:acyl-CoA synthetase (NDP forming)